MITFSIGFSILMFSSNSITMVLVVTFKLLKAGEAFFTTGGAISYSPPLGEAMFAQECMDEASKVEYALKKSLKHLVRDDGKSNTKALNTLINNAVRQYWAMLRPEYFLLLNELASLPKEEHAEAVNPLKNSWRQKEGEFATRLYDEYSEDMDTYGDNIQRQVEGRLILNKRLRTMFEPSEQKDARKPKTDSNTMNK